MWERACSRWRCISQPIHWLIHRHREQARSHMDICVHLTIQPLNGRQPLSLSYSCASPTIYKRPRT
ncbi:hypothetical protein FIV37_09000 [Pseudomonas gessardii]|nr:hypothetical protein [Pseudomonas gessardii]